MLGREGPEAIKILTELGSESAPAGGPVAQGGWRHPASRARKGRRPRAAPRRRRGRGRACCRPGLPPPGPPCLPARRRKRQSAGATRTARGRRIARRGRGSGGRREPRETRGLRQKETKESSRTRGQGPVPGSPGSSPHLLAPTPPPLLCCFCYRLCGAVACRASQHAAAEGSKGLAPIGAGPARGSSPPRARHEGGSAVAKGDTAAGPAIGAAEAWFAARRPTLQRWKWVQQLSGWQKVCTP